MSSTKPHAYRPGTIALRSVTVDREVAKVGMESLMELSKAKANLFRYMFKIQSVAKTLAQDNNKIVLVNDFVLDTVAWFQAKEDGVGEEEEEEEEEEEVNIVDEIKIMKAEYEAKLAEFESLVLQVMPSYPVTAIDTFIAPGCHPMPNWEWSNHAGDWENIIEE